MIMEQPLHRHADFVHKTVTFSFAGETLELQLSQSLFSSFDIDDGSRRLLKTILEGIPLDQVNTVLDIGCGVGVLGLSLKATRPSLQLTVQDRDALALAFTAANARRNNLAPITATAPLAFTPIPNGPFDLIVSNLPGKAGVPVLTQLVQHMPARLTPHGRAAVVVVKPLAEQIQDALLANGSTITLQAGTANYTIFHFHGGHGKPAADPLAPYWRDQHTFKSKSGSYTLTAAHNLPEFDTYGYDTRAAIKLLPALGSGADILFWNPRQGHMPLLLLQAHRKQPSVITLGSRDALSLAVSEHNIQVNSGPDTPIRCTHQATLFEVVGAYDRIVLFPDVDPGVPWARLLPEVLHSRLRPGGKALVAGKSGFIGRMLATQKGTATALTPRQSKKGRGVKAIILEKR